MSGILSPSWKDNPWLRLIHRRILRGAWILRTPYRKLVLHDELNFAFQRLPKSTIKILSEDSEWKILEINGFRFFWPRGYGERDLKYLYQETFTHEEKNPHAYEVRDLRICAGDWVIDAGAYEGFFTHFALNRGANVLMIEPIPKIAEGLKHTFEREIKLGRVRLLNAAVGDRIGVMKLSVPVGKEYCASINSTGDEDVTVYTLESLIEDGVVPRVDYLKMDIEGSEVCALRGATKILRSMMPKLAIAVYHEFNNAQIIRSMLHEIQPLYSVKWRGIFVNPSYGDPRPYMLYAKVDSSCRSAQDRQ